MAMHADFPAEQGQLLDASPIGTVLVDATFCVLWINRAFADLFALDRETVHGRDMRYVVRVLIAPCFEDAENIAAQLLAAYEGKTPLTGLDSRMRTDAGRRTDTGDGERWIALSSHPITAGPWAGGRIDHAIDLSNDRVEPVASEEPPPLQQRMAYYEKLLEHMPMDMAVFDPQGRFRYITQKAVSDPEMRQWLIGRTEHDYCARRGIDPELAERRVAWRDEAIAQRAPRLFEETLVGRDGEVRHFYRQIVPIVGDEEEVTELIGYGIDVTERRRAEATVRRLEEQYRRLFEQSKDVVYVSTPEGKLLDINLAGVELFGYDTKEEMLALDMARDLYLEPWTRDQLVRRLAKHGFVKDFDLRLKARNGNALTVKGTISTVRDEHDQPAAFLGILRDVGARRELQEQLRQSQKMEAVGRLAGGLSHDFNNLLTAINGYSDLILRQLPDDHPLTTFANEIHRAGRRAAELTKKLLMLSRQRLASPQVIDLNRVVRSLESLLQRVIGEDIELFTEAEPALNRVRADPSQIEQALLNLAINSREAMPKGGRLVLTTKNVVVTDQETGSHVGLEPGVYVLLMVTDTGVGIAPEDREHIFEPFFTTKTKSAGSGLGLSTVYAIVHQNNGRIEVESAPQRGTTFRIYLPRFQADATAATTWPQRPRLSPDGGTETILLVEDEPSVRRLMFRTLTAKGYQVLETENGRKAQALVESHEAPIHLVVSDVVMPAMSGPELAAWMHPRFPATRFLYISGYSESFIVQHGLAKNEEDIMQKPFHPDELAAKVREILDRA